MGRFALVAATALLIGCGEQDESAAPPLPLPATAHDHGNPSESEQLMLELIQRARARPAEEGALLVELAEAKQGIEQFMVNVDELVAAFESYSPAPPLAFDAKLAEAARGHANDMATEGFQEHIGTNGSTPVDRITNAGYAFGQMGENIFAYAQSVLHCHAALLIDWGNPDLGHRTITLDLAERTRHVGISTVENPKSPKVGPLVVVQDYGRPLDDRFRYVVGVVFEDRLDNEYDEGEGVEGVFVVPDAGDFYAVTSAGGGFAIPVDPGLGTLRLQAQSEGGEVLAEASVEVADENVKIDFNLDD